MNYLFFLVHPSKIHLFRFTINRLLEKGHHVDIIITSKDVLEDLVKKEDWRYTNLFPKGRRIKHLPAHLSAGIFFFTSLWRIFWFTRKKTYDVFITDDVLGIIGKLRNIPTFHFADDDVAVIKESSFLFNFVSYIIAPKCTNLGKYEKKKIGFSGYKQSGYLHPAKFNPDDSIVTSFNPGGEKYFIIRLVSLNALHDIGKSGITDLLLTDIINMLSPHGKVFISSERELPEKFRKHSLKIKSEEILNVLKYAELLICDGQSMALEAAMLGTPFIRFNDFIGQISVLNEIENKYGLGFGVKSSDPGKLKDTILKLVASPDLKSEWSGKRDNMLADTIDLTEFMVWLFDNYPGSIKTLKEQPDYQENFRNKIALQKSW